MILTSNTRLTDRIAEWIGRRLARYLAQPVKEFVPLATADPGAFLRALLSPATVSRWSNGETTPDLKTQTVIAELRFVVDRLADFYTPDETRLWLHAKHPMLGNARAIDLINSGRTEEVLAVIGALDSGAYT